MSFDWDMLVKRSAISGSHFFKVHLLVWIHSHVFVLLLTSRKATGITFLLLVGGEGGGAGGGTAYFFP